VEYDGGFRLACDHCKEGTVNGIAICCHVCCRQQEDDYIVKYAKPFSTEPLLHVPSCPLLCVLL
jgi:hypothetical protein